ncbi:MAG TPA: PDZ domain-containing protein [Gaiellaceae bacterium]
MRRRITPFRIVACLILALVVTVVILMRIPSGDYLLLPDVAHPVAPLVRVTGGKPAKGGGELYFVDVQEQQASEFDKLFQGLIHPHSTSLPASVLIPPCTSNGEFIQSELRQMSQSQRIAAAVAERQLGYVVKQRNIGVQVDNVYGDVPAACKIAPGDVITAINGKPTKTNTDLQAAMSTVKPGQTIDVEIRRGNSTIHESVKTVADPHNPTRPLIGIFVEPAVEISKLPVKVSIDSGQIGGPSAGLAFTLELMRKLGRDVTHGYRVAATGEIALNGDVLPIGGVEQKTYGVRQAGAQVFLVPARGGNAATAKKYAGPDLKIIPVTSLKQALRALTRLPKLPNE